MRKQASAERLAEVKAIVLGSDRLEQIRFQAEYWERVAPSSMSALALELLTMFDEIKARTCRTCALHNNDDPEDGCWRIEGDDWSCADWEAIEN